MIQAARKAGPATDIWVPTFTGRRVNPRDMRVEDIDVRDIAHHLSLRCRWGCASPFLFSVGQHSLMVSRIVPARDALWALLHDSGEYVSPGDIPRPLKDGPELAAIAAWESNTLRCVAQRYILEWPVPPSVHEADRIVAATEMRDLFPGMLACDSDVRPLPDKIVEMPARVVEQQFLALFRKLWDEAENLRQTEGAI